MNYVYVFADGTTTQRIGRLTFGEMKEMERLCKEHGKVQDVVAIPLSPQDLYERCEDKTE